MKITANGLVFEETNPHCKCILSEAQGELYAFVQCLDMGMDGRETAIVKRYWGRYSHDAREDSIRSILLNGGKWPKLPD
ncbi:hypothetical protein T040_22110 [Salmonella enterica subsp. enterica serovar Senftenberg]|uniref:hypothetical protein n=1 Tax=Enterobacter kobei TaxID=208224 RepID=UPI0012D1DF77|nr:hypothetical protein [Enterobacter kobei]EBM7196732.1 hypothetical protein [Salmonella enterica]EDE1768788.1 hypothetical protein [Salmonella enterica subsp. enterica serovar Senftenberg]EDX6101259.1 hypothetical protein [Salmonella enterica subsp. enterica serovar Braenderup]EBR5803922.1 hypothetical protein [Salmonella enterica]EEJ9532957.1 hypothetical protein [Salmonella enterica subsp. enterica serovar Senftenberg]